MGRLRLFDDVDDHKDDISRIEIDKEFAKRYQHNKEREDLQRYEELAKKGQIEESNSDSSSSDDDEFPDISDPSYKKDIEFFENLLKVKNRDPCLYCPDEHLFKSESDDGESDADGEVKKENKKEKKKKAMYAKDVIAQHLLEEGPEFAETESSENGRMMKSYSEEQEELRREFLNAVKNDEEENGEENEDFLRVKEKKMVSNYEDSDYVELKNKLDEYFGKDEELDEGNKFLKDFFLNKRWMDKEGKGEKDVVEQSELDELLRDEEELERQEEYERRYNFRYEENAGDRVMGHSRKVEASVRKKENTRKEQRKSKDERMKIAEQERKEELKHLKNLKKKEMKKKLEKLMEVAGIEGDADCPFELDGLDDDFDPEEYDKLMKKAFSEKYYEMEDPDAHFVDVADEDCDIEKPDFDKEDELLGLPKGWDVLDSGDGFLAAREMALKLKNDNEEEKDGEENGEENSNETKKKRKRKMSLVKKAKEEMMEEYYKLDYEDTIEDLKTRFKYTKVKPKRYGLKTEEILMMDEKELNQYVSIKKLVPYREKEWKLPNSKRYQLKTRAREVVRGITEDQMTSKKRKLSKVDKSTSVMDSDQNGKSEPETNVDMGNLSRKAKKRQRKAELKLSHSRRIAYGEIQSSAKHKGN